MKGEGRILKNPKKTPTVPKIEEYTSSPHSQPPGPGKGKGKSQPYLLEQQQPQPHVGVQNTNAGFIRERVAAQRK